MVGFSCPVGSLTAAPGVACAIGYFCLGTTNAATMCPAGSYGATLRLTTSACTGTCTVSAGYYCPPGSTSSSPGAQCGPGYFCLGGASDHKLCPVGFYGSASGLTIPSCNGACTAVAGAYCPLGSTLASPGQLCQSGYYCLGGSTAAAQCPPGSYGSAAGNPSPLCTGLCTCAPGNYCPAGSITALGIRCPSGSFCTGNNNVPVPCPQGTHGSTSGLTAVTDCSLCAGGYYGASSGLSSAQCTGPCPAGYVCAPGSISGTNASCPLGSWCPAASVIPTICAAGLYGNQLRLSLANCSGFCAAGYFCAAGSTSSTNQACPAGTFGATPALMTASCSGLCSMGYYCVAASTSSTAAPCPAGTFGSTSGLQSAACSGGCSMGFFCPHGSTSPTAVCALRARGRCCIRAPQTCLVHLRGKRCQNRCKKEY